MCCITKNFHYKNNYEYKEIKNAKPLNEVPHSISRYKDSFIYLYRELSLQSVPSL